MSLPKKVANLLATNDALPGESRQHEQAEKWPRRIEAYLAEAQRLTKRGSWAVDPATFKFIYWSEEMFRIYGFDPTLGLPTPEAIAQRIHPEDRPLMIEALVRLRSASEKTWVGDPAIGDRIHEFLFSGRGKTVGENVGVEIRIVLPDGTLKYIRSYRHPILDETGRFIEYVGTTIDVTEQKKPNSSEKDSGRWKQISRV